MPVVHQMWRVLGPGSLQTVQKIQILQIKKERWQLKNGSKLCQDGESGEVNISKVLLFPLLFEKFSAMKEIGLTFSKGHLLLVVQLCLDFTNFDAN